MAINTVIRVYSWCVTIGNQCAMTLYQNRMRKVEIMFYIHIYMYYLFVFPFIIIYQNHMQFLVGICGCNKGSLEYILSKKGTGNAACLAIGGALEALEAHPGHFTLNLANRKGFIKSAIRTGWGYLFMWQKVNFRIQNVGFSEQSYLCWRTVHQYVKYKS